MCPVPARHQQMLDILEDITRGMGAPEDIDLLLRLAEGIRQGSLCAGKDRCPTPADDDPAISATNMRRM